MRKYKLSLAKLYKAFAEPTHLVDSCAAIEILDEHFFLLTDAEASEGI
jgi:hypothetical protein